MLTITHLEAAHGSLHEAFGIDEYESQNAALTQALEQSVVVTSLSDSVVGDLK